ncbi:MAG: hypothetical protein GWN79_01140 [Actinobacteria bacterium]|nr:hypothetical protein [Actinomycetota bacterium]NIS28789.1 hypothetical protein [Actinomycetota bacterium]NIT94160.1 hypothetical protein [Actinomycetota bacterium]NIU17778.1 hypothetical protein [Actinomycetota bacterium]NIU64236.1 hypothetical protein [Actinomycetota bacterium]
MTGVSVVGGWAARAEILATAAPVADPDAEEFPASFGVPALVRRRTDR